MQVQRGKNPRVLVDRPDMDMGAATPRGHKDVVLMGTPRDRQACACPPAAWRPAICAFALSDDDDRSLALPPRTVIPAHGAIVRPRCIRFPSDMGAERSIGTARGGHMLCRCACHRRGAHDGQCERRGCDDPSTAPHWSDPSCDAISATIKTRHAATMSHPPIARAADRDSVPIIE
jgi:hypothetical protein